SYTFNKSLNTSELRTSDHIAYHPEHFIKLYWAFVKYDYLSTDIAFTYSSDKFYQTGNAWSSLSDYRVWDVGLHSKLSSVLKLWVKVTNVFDANYFSVFDQPQAG